MVLCSVITAAAAVFFVLRRKKLSVTARKGFFVFLIMALFGVMLGIQEKQNPVLIDGTKIKRNETGKGYYQEELDVSVENLIEGYSYPVEIPEQALTSEEEQAYLKAAEHEIEEEFVGENESVNCIRGKVVISDTYQDGHVYAEWHFDSYDVIDGEGKIQSDELTKQGELVEASVSLSCGDSMSEYRFQFRVYPDILTEQERVLKILSDFLEQEKVKKGEEYLSLPGEVMGYSVSWAKKGEHLPEKMLLLGIIAAVLIPLSEHKREQDRQKKREQQLLLEYPAMVSKLSLLLGSGMTLNHAWNKIVSSYIRKREKDHGAVLPVYEEMLVTMYEMKSGVGEERAYTGFGERCGLQRYRKLGNILVQNLKKGNRGMVELLEAEAENAFEERKNLARKYGEEAGTKLLFPMMIMLAMIMMLLIIPAFLSFRIT